MIQRYDWDWLKRADGIGVLYTDHLAAITEKDREIERLQTNIDVMKRALRWSECEEDGDG